MKQRRCACLIGIMPALLVAHEQAILDHESIMLRDAGGLAALYGEPADPVREAIEHEQKELVDAPISDLPRKRTRTDLLAEVDESWIRPPDRTEMEKASVNNADPATRDRLDKVFVPKVEFRDLPLSQVVVSLAEFAEGSQLEGGVNIVLIDPENRDPRVSILLRRLSLLRVLDFVVESVGFEYNLTEGAVVLRPRQGPGFGLETSFYPISRSTLIRLTGIQEDADIVDPEVIPDPFSPVDPGREDDRTRSERQLKGFLQRAGIPFDGVEGADLALADGQLIVTQTARNHEKLTQLLRKYREVKQVEIEARFLEVEEQNLEELGLEWTLVNADKTDSFTFKGRNLASAFSVGQEESSIVIDRVGLDLPEIKQGAPVLPVTVDLAEDAMDVLSVYGSLGGLDVDVILRALERQSGNDLLSAPKLTVLSGKTAEIVVAEEFRYPESYGDTAAEVGRGDSTAGSAGVAITAGTPQSFTTRNVGVEMEVTPTVEEDNSISLRLKPKVTEFEGFVEYGETSVAIASDTTVTVPSGFYQPIFSVREVNTEVTIYDGATVVMGGLTREHSVRVTDKVPLLGNLPVLGPLFRTEGESSQKRNLLIFVTANLVSPGGSPAFQRIPDRP